MQSSQPKSGLELTEALGRIRWYLMQLCLEAQCNVNSLCEQSTAPAIGSDAYPNQAR